MFIKKVAIITATVKRDNTLGVSPKAREYIGVSNVFYVFDNLKLHSTEGFPLLHELLRIESYRTMIWAWNCTFSDYHCQFPKEPLAATRLMLATFTNHSVFPISLSVLILFWSASKINWTRFSYLYQLSDVYFVHISIYVFLCSATLIRISYWLHGFRRH